MNSLRFFISTIFHRLYTRIDEKGSIYFSILTMANSMGERSLGGMVGSVGTRSRGRVSINWKAENREECSLPVLLEDWDHGRGFQFQLDSYSTHESQSVRLARKEKDDNAYAIATQLCLATTIEAAETQFRCAKFKISHVPLSLQLFILVPFPPFRLTFSPLGFFHSVISFVRFFLREKKKERKEERKRGGNDEENRERSNVLFHFYPIFSPLGRFEYRLPYYLPFLRGGKKERRIERMGKKKKK